MIVRWHENRWIIVEVDTMHADYVSALHLNRSVSRDQKEVRFFFINDFFFTCYILIYNLHYIL